MQEIWKDVVGYEGIYQVSNFGNVKRIIFRNNKTHIGFERRLKPCKQTNKKYCSYTVTLSKNGICKQHRVHQLVAKAFIENNNNRISINHIDGNPLNNHYKNLEWCTQLENNIHAIETGLRKVFKISEKELYKLYVIEGKNAFEIAELKCTTHYIIYLNLKKYNIKTRTSSEINSKYKLTKEFLKYEMFECGKTITQISKEVGCSQSNVSKIITRLKLKNEWNMI